MAELKYEAKHGCNISLELDGYRCFFSPQHEDTRYSYPVADALFLSEIYEPLNNDRDHSETYEVLAGANVYAKENARYLMLPSLMDHLSNKHNVNRNDQSPLLMEFEKSILERTERFSIGDTKSFGGFEVSLLQISTSEKETAAAMCAYLIEFKGRRIAVLRSPPLAGPMQALRGGKVDFLIIGSAGVKTDFGPFEKVMKCIPSRKVILPKWIKKGIPKTGQAGDGSAELIFFEKFKECWDDPN